MRTALLVSAALSAGCCDCGLYFPPPFLSPSESPAPTNVLVVTDPARVTWIPDLDTAVEDEPAQFVSEADDIVVPAVVTPVRIGADSWYQLWEPLEPLAPDTQWKSPTWFSTASGPDEVAPPEVAVTSVERERDPRCGPWMWVHTETGTDDVAFVEMEISESEDMSGALRWYGPPQLGGCWNTERYPWDGNADLYIRTRAVDLAGNTSAWSEPFFYDAPACATGGSSPGPAALLALLLVRRRRGC